MLKSELESKRKTNEYKAYQVKELAATDTVKKKCNKKKSIENWRKQGI